MQETTRDVEPEPAHFARSRIRSRITILIGAGARAGAEMIRYMEPEPTHVNGSASLETIIELHI